MLPRVPREIKTRFGIYVPYNRLYKGALNGTLPIDQDPASGRYSVAEEKLPEIAAAFAPAESPIAA